MPETEQRLTDQSGDSAPWFRMLVERIPKIAGYVDLVIADDPGHSIPLYISPQIEDLLGYTLSDWLGEGELWLQILHPEDADRMRRADEEARRLLTPLSAEYRMIAADGSVVWVSEKAAVVQDESTGTLYWQGVMVDIAAREAAPMGVVIANSAAERILTSSCLPRLRRLIYADCRHFR